MTETDALNAAYRERAQLTALIAALYPSHIGHTDPNEPDWAVLTIELPTGQACFHVSLDDMALFSHVDRTPRFARGWDGHTTEQKYERIQELIRKIEGGSQPRVPYVAAASDKERIILPNDAFDELAATLDRPAQAVPELVELFKRNRAATGNTEATADDLPGMWDQSDLTGGETDAAAMVADASAEAES